MLLNTPSRKVFFAIARRVTPIGLDGENSTPRNLVGSVEVEGVEVAPCKRLADIYFIDGSVAVDVSLTGAMLC
jgi:hypothetical protein